MTGITHRSIDSNGIRMHVAEAGRGPLVVLCHGFPECWYSWRHQLLALADAGYHAVAPDMRGYGGTDAPAAVDQYSIFHLVGDIVGLLDALEAPRAVVVGHDWGAPVAWHCALFRPDRFRGVAGFSVPYYPRASRRPSLAMPRSDDAVFYQTYFNDEGVAETEFDADVRRTLRNIAWLWSGDRPRDGSAVDRAMVPVGGPMLADVGAPAQLPAWLSEADVDVYADAFRRSGFRGPLNWYRNIDRNWEQTAPWAGAQIRIPALYMVGERDLVLGFKGMDRLLPNLQQVIPALRVNQVVPGCGHWIQRERAALVSDALLAFVKDLPE